MPLRRYLLESWESLAEFAPVGAKKLKSVFDRGMYVGENTSRPANVRTVRLWRTVSALQQAAIPLSEKAAAFFDSLKHPWQSHGCFR